MNQKMANNMLFYSYNVVTEILLGHIPSELFQELVQVTVNLAKNVCTTDTADGIRYKLRRKVLDVTNRDISITVKKGPTKLDFWFAKQGPQDFMIAYGFVTGKDQNKLYMNIKKAPMNSLQDWCAQLVAERCFNQRNVRKLQLPHVLSAQILALYRAHRRGKFRRLKDVREIAWCV